MAVMSCPHCGKELYDGLLECPYCFGPISQNVELAIDEIVAERNRKEKKALITCAVIGLICGIIMCVGAIVEKRILLGIGLLPLAAFVATCELYGMRWAFGWVKTTGVCGFLVFPIAGWMVCLLFVMTFGAIAGIILGPVAFIKMMAKKPLVSKEKVLKELAKKTD